MAAINTTNATGRFPAVVNAVCSLCGKAMLQKCSLFSTRKERFSASQQSNRGGGGTICNVLSLVVEGYYIYRNSNGGRDYILRSDNITQ
jgi:hypothetical protein